MKKRISKIKNLPFYFAIGLFFLLVLAKFKEGYSTDPDCPNIQSKSTCLNYTQGQCDWTGGKFGTGPYCIKKTTPQPTSKPTSKPTSSAPTSKPTSSAPTTTTTAAPLTGCNTYSNYNTCKQYSDCAWSNEIYDINGKTIRAADNNNFGCSYKRNYLVNSK